MSAKKKFLLILISCVLAIPELMLGVLLSDDGASVIALVCCWVLSIMFTIVAMQLEKKYLEARVRLYTHAVVSYLSFYVFALLSKVTPLSGGGLLGVTFGVYFFLYYVLGVVQIPFNILYHKRGYRFFYRPFYPFFSKKQRQRLLFGGADSHAKDLEFSVDNVHGRLTGDFLYVEGHDYGEVNIERKYLLVELPLGAPWTDKEFSAFKKAMWKYSFRAVGYSVNENSSSESAGTRIVVVPDRLKYAKGREALDKFFSSRKLDAEMFVNDYEDFGKEVIPLVLPFYSDECSLYLSEPFHRSKVSVLNRLLCFYAGKRFKETKGVEDVVFTLAFPREIPKEQLLTFAAECEKKNFFCLDVFTVEKGNETPISKDEEAELPSGAEAADWPVPLTSKLHYDSGANALILRKTVSFNVAYKPAEPKLLRALALYRTSQVLYGEKKTGLARSFAKFADLTLRSVRSEDEDDVMFASDTLFRLRDFSESRLTWVSKGKEEGYWATDLATPKVEKMFEMVKEATLRKAEYWSGDNLTDETETIHTLGASLGAITLLWRLDR